MIIPPKNSIFSPNTTNPKTQLISLSPLKPSWPCPLANCTMKNHIYIGPDNVKILNTSSALFGVSSLMCSNKMKCNTVTAWNITLCSTLLQFSRSSCTLPVQLSFTGIILVVRQINWTIEEDFMINNLMLPQYRGPCIILTLHKFTRVNFPFRGRIMFTYQNRHCPRQSKRSFLLV